MAVTEWRSTSIAPVKLIRFRSTCCTAQLEALLVTLAGALPVETYQLVETLLLRCALCGTLFTAPPPHTVGFRIHSAVDSVSGRKLLR